MNNEAPERYTFARKIGASQRHLMTCEETMSPGNPNDTPYIREDLHAAEVQRLQERVRDLKEALEWAVSEIEGRTLYTNDAQLENCIKRARVALNKDGNT